jgi:hypothetical protein
MNAHPLVRLVPRSLTLLVAAVSGAYLLVYLYRWEWNRAVISGIFFVAAEVAFVGSSLRSEVRGLADRLDAADAQAERRIATTLGAHGSRPARPFAWLRASIEGGTNVFVPVLLGMGVLFSAVAYVVERLANSIGRAAVDAGVARRLVALEPTPHGLLGPRDRRPAPRPPRSWGRRAAWALAAGALAIGLGAAIHVIADATQSRPAAERRPAGTEVEVRVDQRGGQELPVVVVVDALTTACRSTLPEDHQVEPARALGPDRASFRVAPGLGELGRRRFLGCVQDSTLDLVRAEVSGVWQLAA